MFFDAPNDSSFVFSVTEGTPSPRKHAGKTGLKTKYTPRDSGVVMSDDDGPSMHMHMRRGGTLGASGSIGGLGDFLSVMPRASNSVSSVYSEELDTPGLSPGERSGWPEAIVVTNEEGNANANGVKEDEVEVDAFIQRTLAAATKGPEQRRASDGGLGYGMKIPGTPVKKVKTSHMGIDGGRPWQSAVTAKVGGLEFDLQLQKHGKAPRKSMPAVFPWRGKAADKDTGGDTESEGEEDSPSFRKEARYDGLGIGRPRSGAASGRDNGGGAFSRLMRRSSSGIFASANDSPTKGKDTPTSYLCVY
jgi:mitosis inhibitor protein kinase SWE1